MSSEISTESRQPSSDAGFEVWHFYVLISMVAATAAVMLARDTHPAALLLLSAAVIAAGFVGLMLHRALLGFAGEEPAPPPAFAGDVRTGLEQEKALTLRSIKELEFDRAMGKVSDRDFEDVQARLRARAMVLMEEIDQLEAAPKPAPVVAKAPAAASAVCAACDTANDPDARFCKSCGKALG